MFAFGLQLTLLLVTGASTQSEPPSAVVPLQTDEEAMLDGSSTTSSTNDIFAPIVLLPFMQLAHGLRSGPITIVDLRTFFIRDLYYDGKGPDAHFWVGKGAWPSENGTLVPNENNSDAPLTAYDGQNVTISLPGDLTVDQIDYLAMWCVKFKHNFGHTILRRERVEEYGVELAPFSRLAHGLRSGPIVAVDRKTFFVPNLHYDGKGPDTHFWAGKGEQPSPSGVLVPDERGSSKSLSAYAGQSVYVTLPGNLTTDDIDYLGLWCVKFEQNFGHTKIPRDLAVPQLNGNPLYTFDNRKIVRVPKCCPHDEVLAEGGCEASKEKFDLHVNVHEHNATHINDEPIKADTIEFVPYVQAIDCSHQRYPLDPEEDVFPLLNNGSLVVQNTRQILSPDNFCMETVNLDDAENKWVTTAILCFSGGDVPLSKAFFYIYIAGIVFSIVAHILTVLVFLLTKEVRDTRGKCIMFYCGSMAITFTCLMIAQTFSVIDVVSCKIIAFVVQFFLVSSFTWLTMISCETYCKVLFHNSEAYTQDRRRMVAYVVIGLFVPLCTFLISIVVDQRVDIGIAVMKLQFGRKSCWFDDNRKALPYFYIPIGLSILVNTVVVILTKVKLVQFQRTRDDDIAWQTLKDELKPMFRACAFLLGLMTVCWMTEIVSALLKNGDVVWKAIDIINSFQGVIVFIIFAAHRPVNICKRRRRREVSTPPREMHEALLSNGTQEFLTKLHRVDSTEFN